MGFPCNNNLLLLVLLLGAMPARAQDHKKFVLVPKGIYEVGKRASTQNPLRTVQADSFRIAVYETTNREFAAFVTATGYITDAEKQHNALVFEPGLDEFRWKNDSTAYWRYPNGVSRGGINDRMNHPVTCISYRDVQAYCTWAGVRLPTLDEWEIACRAGTHTSYFFGDDDKAIKAYANVWHGHDHKKADYSDGYMYTSPVGHFTKPRNLFHAQWSCDFSNHRIYGLCIFNRRFITRFLSQTGLYIRFNHYFISEHFPTLLRRTLVY